jgi:hypothetical protein
MSTTCKTFNVTVKVVREFSATIEIHARNQAEAEKIALSKYWDFACGRDGDMEASCLGFPPPWREHDCALYDPEIDRRFHCVDCGKCTSSSGEYYMVRDEIWAASGLGPIDGMLCLRCLERRIERELTLDDFTAIMPRREAWERHVASRSAAAPPSSPPEQLTML